ncbi:MAG: hypothetical protein H0X02_13295, partial [Nitrosomonas sp.]|nr:hypothetical protein [Nitrosomonas sp.]
MHDGHLAFAATAIEAGLQKVMFLVEPRPRRKQAVRALEHRIAMVQLAIADEPSFGTIKLEHARFTVHETLPVLQARFAGFQLVFLFGDDVIQHIADWPHVDALVSGAELLIASRHSDEKNLLQTFTTLEQTRNLSFRRSFVHPNQQQMTSSRIRLGLKQREPVGGVPQPV